MGKFGDARGDLASSDGHFITSNSFGVSILISELNVTLCIFSLGMQG